MNGLDGDENGSLERRLEALEDELATLRRTQRTSHEGGSALRTRVEAVAGELQALLAEANGGHGTIDTRTGGRITPLEADPDAVSLDDIAHALSNLTRFAGQGTEFYSVARHSVHVSHEVEARGGSRDAIRWGLLHDATEAYLADVPAPVKRSLPGYTRVEADLAATVRDAFEIDLSSADGRLVEAADSAVGRDELARYLPNGDHERQALECEPPVLEQEDDVAELFVQRARALGCETHSSRAE
ncbi:hypothetical protein SAMN04487967_3139 [Natronorubrum sediminis]|uniref:HD domain-containing protein n=1 Tax=Natronorubrum sediminis TaxID=640943 RepID=A0A1H6G2R8_9EURY|nr:hypothetical protein [Natronorubrum sediminis]SEH17386.1 hypothetical protein SAMN04487967_3139 [Natronorubrum sediminis]